MISAQRFVHRGLRSMGLHLQRWRDPYMTMAKLLRGRKVEHVIDGGAYHGGAAKKLLSLFPAATVHAFEPQKASFELLRGKFKAEPRIRIYPAALSDCDGTAELRVNSKAFTTSLLVSEEPDSMGPSHVENIATVTLDDWARRNEVRSAQVMKLDLQGHELAALRGAGRLLEEGTDIVLTEVNIKPRYSGTCLFHEVAAYLHQKNFRLFQVYEIINDSEGAWQQADALFVHAHLL